MSPMGPVGMPDLMGISTKGNLYTDVQGTNQVIEPTYLPIYLPMTESEEIIWPDTYVAI